MYSPVFLFWIWGGSWTSQTLPHCEGEPGFHGDGREEGGTRLKRPQDWLTFFFVQLERSLTASIYSIMIYCKTIRHLLIFDPVHVVAATTTQTVTVTCCSMCP